MDIFFAGLYDFFNKRKAVFWIVFLLSFVLLIYSSINIDLKEDVSSMLPDSKAAKTMTNVIGNTKAGEQVVFLLSGSSNKDILTGAADSFTNALYSQFDEYIDTIALQPSAGVEQELVGLVSKKLPLLLKNEDYALIDSLIQPERVEQTLRANKRILLSPASAYYKRLVASDPLGISNIVWQKLSALQKDTTYESYNGYFFHKESNQLMFFLKPFYKSNETGKNSKFFEALDEYINIWQTGHQELGVTYFGAAAVAAGNATQMRKDTILTLSLTVLLLLLVTFYYFRRKRVPLLLLVPVLYGAAAGVGIINWFKGSISIIALGAGAIVMGIAIDFSIHFLSHARKSNSIRTSVKELAQPLTLGSATTIIAFLALTLIDTPILQDLGLFAATSLLGAALCTLIFLPHLISTKSASRKDYNTVFDKLALLKPERNKWLLISIVVLTPVLLYFSSDVQFDSDLNNLNFLSPKLEKAQDKIAGVNSDVLGSVYVMSKGRTEDEALANIEHAATAFNELESNTAVDVKVNPALLYLSQSEQERRIEKWKNYWQENSRDSIVAKNIRLGAKKVGFKPEAFNRFEETLTEGCNVYDDAEKELIKSLFPSGFATYNNEYYVVSTLKVDQEYREDVFNNFANQENIIVTDRQDVAGQLADVLTGNFTDIALYSSLIVFIALLVGYGRIELAIIAFIPMAVSWVWILGIMSLLGLKFNVVNIIISSLIFGLGDDYTIFTMDGLVERYKTGKQKLASVRAAVYISAVTVVIGLGVLLLAKHPALKSIAFISVTGLVCVLFISQTLQPFLFNWLIQKRADKKFLPFTLLSLFISIFAFVYFVTGAIVLTILGIIFTKLWPFNKENGKYYFHLWISRYTWSIMYIMRNQKVKLYNVKEHDFNKPAVIIANHSSFLDILATTMLHPKVVLLTNKWVWNSPVFGAVVRMGEYYPVADGAEASIEPLRDLVQRGYSVVVFPEGTRSYDGNIKRFHKGAFYIAEQLKLDIVPLLLHGISYNMQKGDWLLKNGTVSIYAYPRVSVGDKTYGDSYSQRAKYMGRWMRKELEAVRAEKETPSYFKERIIRSYTYKGPVLEWYCRTKVKLENYYETFHKLIPRHGEFYDLGCGYGFMTYMLHWAAPDRRFTSIDYDEQKIETAQNNLFKNEDIHFESADITAVELKPCDGVIISDVLHYLLPNQQEELLLKCATAIKDNGVLVIRDGVAELKDRIKGTELTELFSTKILSFNKTQNDLHYISQKYIENFATKHGFDLQIIDKTKFTANLIFILKKKTTV